MRYRSEPTSHLRRRPEHDIETRGEFAGLRAFQWREINGDRFARLLVVNVSPDAVPLQSGDLLDEAAQAASSGQRRVTHRQRADHFLVELSLGKNDCAGMRRFSGE